LADESLAGPKPVLEGAGVGESLEPLGDVEGVSSPLFSGSELPGTSVSTVHAAFAREKSKKAGTRARRFIV
jgi:hypothetical protein